ncbi:MAG TPA: family 1 encapsulin nanocompartment shell protein [Armatimonadota bacterium]|nr:family 1 encapsulin nanocompartment shell protein [Armatimonadota bacterium]
MQDLLYRDDAPLTPEEWEQLDNTVTSIARRLLVARRFLDVFGPLGAGVQDIDYHVYGPLGEANISLLGEEDQNPIQPLRRVHEHIPMIYKDFMLYWRDIETARREGTPLDTGSAAAAAAFVAQKEDDLILNGNQSYGFQGFLTAQGAHSIDAGDWVEAGSAFKSITAAVQTLLDDGFFPPYAVVVNPVAYAQMQRVYECSGVLEIEHIRQLVQGGVFQSQAITDSPGVVLSLGPQNFDLAIAQDIITGYLGPVGLNHPFRVFETLVLRIKRPQAICRLNGPTPDPSKIGGEPTQQG